MSTLSAAPMAWSLLLVAGLLEIVWAVSTKASAGFTKHASTGITLVAAWLAFWLLGLAMARRGHPRRAGSGRAAPARA
jgi:quaternary ammonium compound-resistance protein SugE